MSTSTKIKTFIKSLALVAMVAIVSIEAPFAHRSYIRGIAEDNAVRIVGMDGMGTGFHVQAPNGKVYLLTNKHVCSMTGPLKVEKYGDKIGVVSKVIAKYAKHDLCVMEALPGATGIKISSDPAENGDKVFILGHPRGDALNVSEGEKFDNKEIHIGQEVEADGTCSEGSLVKIETIFGDFSICDVPRMSIQFSNPTYPGNSGSAVVNKWGRLVSVVFAGSRQIENQGFGLELSAIRDFLSTLK